MTGRTVVVTGAFGALGSVVAAQAARQGEVVVAIDHAPEPPQEGAGLVGARGVILSGVDLTDEAAAVRAIESAKARTGRIDVLINIAGGFAWRTVQDADAALWERMWALNVRTALNASRAALAHLIASGEGRIVNVGAAAAVKAAAGMGAYAASKSGVARLTESLADELKGRGVTVNAVLPSIIDTPANRADMPEADHGRWVAPADLAAVILFLASREAKAVTGALVPVIGGM